VTAARWRLAVAAVAASATAPVVAHAAPLLEAPAGWVSRDDLALGARTRTMDVEHFGTHGDAVTTEAYAAPHPGLVLYVTRIEVKPPADVAVAVRGEVDALHAMSRRAALTSTSVAEDGWQERVDAATHQIEASLSWHDAEAHSAEHARLVIAASATALVGITGECIAGAGAVAADVAGCQAALATLDPGVADRVPIALAPVGATPPPAPPVATGSDADAGSAVPDGPPSASPRMAPPPAAHMSDGTHAPLPPIVVSRERPGPDRRPVYVGLGVVVLAAMFYWNRRRRTRLEEQESRDDR